MSKNNRKSERLPVNLLVDYRSDGNYLFDFCQDVGSGGVFIRTEKPLSEGSKLDLVFTLPDSKETFNTEGTVIWSQPVIKDDQIKNPPGMGVQFSSFSLGEQKKLADFIERSQSKNKKGSKSVSNTGQVSQKKTSKKTSHGSKRKSA